MKNTKANDSFSLSNVYDEGSIISSLYPVAYIYPEKEQKETDKINLIKRGNPIYTGRTISCFTEDDSQYILIYPQTEDLLPSFTKLNEPMIKPDNLIVLPNKIRTATPQKHDQIILEFINQLNKKIYTTIPYEISDSLQPISDSTLDYLNNKINLPKLLNEEHELMPKRFIIFINGEAFSSYKLDKNEVQMPCVIKLSNSSGGLGVRLCKTKKDFTTAQKDFSSTNDWIHIEEFIEGTPFSVQFTIPRRGEIKCIGSNFQILDGPELEGGTIKGDLSLNSNVEEKLKKSILKKAQDIGFHGICIMGGIIDNNNKFYMFDPNFRPNASMNHAVARMRMGGIHASNQTMFTAEIPRGKLKTLESLAKNSGDRIMRVSTMASDGAEKVIFNGAILHDSPETLRENTTIVKENLKIKNSSFVLNYILKTPDAIENLSK